MQQKGVLCSQSVSESVGCLGCRQQSFSPQPPACSYIFDSLKLKKYIFCLSFLFLQLVCSERFPDGRSADVDAEHIRPSVGSELSEHLPDADDHQAEQKGRHQWGYRRSILVS